MRSAPTTSMTVAAVAIVAAAALAACGGASDSAALGSGSSGEEGTASIKVGYFPLVHTASAVNAQEEGLFADEGLEVELVQTAGGAQAIPSLMAGEFDITYTNYTSAILAAQQGLPLKIAAGNDVGAEDHAIMVNGDSPLREPADLGGKTVAVNNLQNIGTVAVNAVLEDAGVDIETVNYIELPYPDMQAALDRGDVDAIWQVEPFQASALAAGDRVLFELFSGPVDDMPVAGWVTTTQFAQENSEAIDAFQRALGASVDQLQDNRERLVELVPTYTQVPIEVVEKVAIPAWNVTPDRAQLQKLADFMEKYGIIAEPFDVSTVLVESS
ncbi:MAG: ABC transporter substrate-binding protein [Haloechinothrix sp.]